MGIYFQNFFKDAWNIFDLITVLGSIVDALWMEFGVIIKKNTLQLISNIKKAATSVLLL